MSLFMLCLWPLFNSGARNGNLAESLSSDITLASWMAQALPKSITIGIKSKAFLSCSTTMLFGYMSLWSMAASMCKYLTASHTWNAVFRQFSSFSMLLSAAFASVTDFPSMEWNRDTICATSPYQAKPRNIWIFGCRSFLKIIASSVLNSLHRSILFTATQVVP